jgi:DNA repair exonuclease SbcCD ATPase subunit
MSKIIQLTAENVKRLTAVQITPQGNVVVIGGKNGQGKTSCLDAIEYALGGDTKDKMPVRRGEEKARIVLDLGDLVIKRSFTAAGGTSLVVENKDGVKQKSPQGILDALVGKLTFDPLSFSRQNTKEQADTLRRIVGLDTAADDDGRVKLFQERTNVNRDTTNLKARFSAMIHHADAPKEELSASDILAEQQAASEFNRQNEKERSELREVKKNMDFAQSFVVSLEEYIKELEAELKQKKDELRHKNEKHLALKKAHDQLSESCALLQDKDLAPFRERLNSVESGNRKFRENKLRQEVVLQFKAKSDEADKLTEKIDAIDAKKRHATLNAKYPIEGLGFDLTGAVTLNGIPFEQASTSEQLKVSVAIGIALNPTLKILLIRDGSLLDEDSMKLLCEMAKQHDVQVWLERVGNDAQTSVVIEDGHIAT